MDAYDEAQIARGVERVLDGLAYLTAAAGLVNLAACLRDAQDDVAGLRQRRELR